MAKYIIRYKNNDKGGMFLNYEWHKGRKCPECIYAGMWAQMMNERQVDYFIDMLNGEEASFEVITIK